MGTKFGFVMIYLALTIVEILGATSAQGKHT